MDSIETVVPSEGGWIPRDFSNGRNSQGGSLLSLRNDRGAAGGEYSREKGVRRFCAARRFRVHGSILDDETAGIHRYRDPGRRTHYPHTSCPGATTTIGRVQRCGSTYHQRRSY